VFGGEVVANYKAVRLGKEDVVLLPITAADAADYMRIINAADVGVHTNHPLPFQQSNFDEMFARTQQNPPLLIWMIAYRDMICGSINASDPRDVGIFQGGYWLLPEFRKKGIARIALMLLKQFLLKECNAKRLQAMIEPENQASRALVEACGYQCEGILRRFYPARERGLIDVCMYAYLSEAIT